MEEHTTRDLLGWKITVWKEPDYDADLDWLGTYSRTPNEYAIETGREGNYLPYFNPPIENYLGSTEEEMEKYCRQDYERMESYNRTWGMIAIKASLSYKGIELGEASVWGNEDNWNGKDNEWHNGIKDDVLAEAIAEARKNLETLKEII